LISSQYTAVMDTFWRRRLTPVVRCAAAVA
jgi:hypothetical protein